MQSRMVVCQIMYLHKYVLFIPEQVSLLDAAKLMVISMIVWQACDTCYCRSSSIANDSKATFAVKFSFLANKLQATTSTATLPMVTNQENNWNNIG